MYLKVSKFVRFLVNEITKIPKKSFISDEKLHAILRLNSTNIHLYGAINIQSLKF